MALMHASEVWKQRRSQLVVGTCHPGGRDARVPRPARCTRLRSMLEPLAQPWGPAGTRLPNRGGACEGMPPQSSTSSCRGSWPCWDTRLESRLEGARQQLCAAECIVGAACMLHDHAPYVDLLRDNDVVQRDRRVSAIGMSDPAICRVRRATTRDVEPCILRGMCAILPGRPTGTAPLM